jgi:hypothetical protein
LSSNTKNRTPKSEVIKYKKSETPRLGLSSASTETPNRSDLGFSRLGLCKNPQIDGIGYCRVRVWQEPIQIRDLGFSGSQESRLTLGTCQQQGFSLTNPITPRLIQYPARRDTGILPVFALRSCCRRRRVAGSGEGCCCSEESRVEEESEIQREPKRKVRKRDSFPLPLSIVPPARISENDGRNPLPFLTLFARIVP